MLLRFFVLETYSKKNIYIYTATYTYYIYIICLLNKTENNYFCGTCASIYACLIPYKYIYKLHVRYIYNIYFQIHAISGQCINIKYILPFKASHALILNFQIKTHPELFLIL